MRNVFYNERRLSTLHLQASSRMHCCMNCRDIAISLTKGIPAGKHKPTGKRGSFIFMTTLVDG